MGQEWSYLKITGFLNKKLNRKVEYFVEVASHKVGFQDSWLWSYPEEHPGTL